MGLCQVPSAKCFLAIMMQIKCSLLSENSSWKGNMLKEDSVILSLITVSVCCVLVVYFFVVVYIALTGSQGIRLTEESIPSHAIIKDQVDHTIFMTLSSTMTHALTITMTKVSMTTMINIALTGDKKTETNLATMTIDQDHHLIP